MKQTDSNKEIEKGNSKLNLFSSKELSNAIKNLSKPRFLGSIHFNKDLNPNLNFSSVENLLKGDLELKINNSLKNTILNPITITLIVLMIVFNLIWIIFFYLL